VLHENDRKMLEVSVMHEVKPSAFTASARVSILCTIIVH
jgi:hypothetical protein